MDFITAVSIIKKDMEEARALLDQLSTTPGTHIAEIELARSRIRSATEMLGLLPRLKDEAQNENEIKVVTEAEFKTEVKAATEVEAVREIETVPEIVAATKVGAAVPPAPVIEAKNESDPVNELLQAKTPEAIKAILADRFIDTGRLGEKVTSVRQDEVITSAMHARPIEDIAGAIGINDRFYYIRELFSGDNKAYHDTLKRLNSAASLGEAMRILDESTVMGSDPAAQSSFVDVVRRKFNIDG